MCAWPCSEQAQAPAGLAPAVELPLRPHRPRRCPETVPLTRPPGPGSGHWDAFEGSSGRRDPLARPFPRLQDAQRHSPCPPVLAGSLDRAPSRVPTCPGAPVGPGNSRSGGITRARGPAPQLPVRRQHPGTSEIAMGSPSNPYPGPVPRAAARLGTLSGPIRAGPGGLWGERSVDAYSGAGIRPIREQHEKLPRSYRGPGA